jgi:hypothetical protein
MWAKNMTVADQRWREAWERKLAERRKAQAKVQRIAGNKLYPASMEKPLSQRTKH